MKPIKVTPVQLCLVAMAVGINVAGGQLALALHGHQSHLDPKGLQKQLERNLWSLCLWKVHTHNWGRRLWPSWNLVAFVIALS